MVEERLVFLPYCKKIGLFGEFGSWKILDISDGYLMMTLGKNYLQENLNISSILNPIENIILILMLTWEKT